MVRPIESIQIHRITTAVAARIRSNAAKLPSDLVEKFTGTELKGSQLEAFTELVTNTLLVLVNAPAPSKANGELENEAQEALLQVLREFGAATVLRAFTRAMAEAVADQLIEA